MAKEPLVQLHSVTGLSQDYMNEYWRFCNGFKIRETLNDEQIMRLLKESPRKYTERFPPGEFEYALDSRVKQLDALAEQAKALASPERFSRDALAKIIGEAYNIVHGRQQDFTNSRV